MASFPARSAEARETWKIRLLEGRGSLIVDDRAPIPMAAHTLVIVPRHRPPKVLGSAACSDVNTEGVRTARYRTANYEPPVRCATRRHLAGLREGIGAASPMVARPFPRCDETGSHRARRRHLGHAPSNGPSKTEEPNRP